MKRIIWITTIMMLVINMYIPIKLSCTNIAYANEIPVLNETDARNLLCFLYDKNLTVNEMANDEYFKLLTGKLSGEDAEIKRMGFAMYVELQLNSNIENASNKCDIAYGNLVELLEKRVGSDPAQETLKKVQGEIKRSMKSVFNTLTDDYFEDMQYVLDGVNTIKDIPGKAQKYVDNMMICLNSLAVLNNSDTAARYIYFSSYLTARKSMSPDEEIFRIMMSEVELQLADHYSTSMFDFFPGDKTNWHSYKSDIEKWAEYTYQFIGNPTAKREPDTGSGGGSDPSTTVLYDNLYINGDYMISSGTLNLNGHNLVVIGDLIQTGGTINVNGGAVIVYGNLNLQKGTINNSSNSYVTADTLNMSSGTYINDGYTYVQNNATVSGTIAGNLNVYGDLISSSAKITNLNIFGTVKQTISGNSTVSNLTLRKTSNVNMTGSISVNGILRENESHITGGKNIILNSTGSIIGTIYKNSLTLNGASVSNMIFEKTLYTQGTTSLSNVIVNNMIYQKSGTINLNGDLTVKGDAYIGGTINGTEHTLKLYGDLSGISNAKISSLTMCSDKPQKIINSIAVTDFYNNNMSSKGLNVNSAITVNGKIHSENMMQNGKNIKMTSTASFAKDYYIGDVTLNGLSGNLPADFRGNLYTAGGTITLSRPSTVTGMLSLSGGTIDINDTVLTVNGKCSGTSNINLKHSELALNGVTTLGGTISLIGSNIKSNKFITNNAKINLDNDSYIKLKTDITNGGTISGEGQIFSSGSIINNGSIDINVLNLNETTPSEINGKDITVKYLNIYGGSKIKLNTNINVLNSYENDNTSIDEDKIILPVDESLPLKSLTSTNGLTLDNKITIVNGNCKISGGAISLTNGARLIVNKVFTASGTTFYIDDTSELVIKQYSIINSFSNIVNDGKITFGSDTSLTSTKLSGDGEYVLLGDLYMASSSINKPNKFIISGGTPQKLSGGTMNFNNLYISNSSTAGIEFGTAAQYYGEIENENTPIKGTLTKMEAE